MTRPPSGLVTEEPTATPAPLGETAASAFAHFHTVNIWGNEGFVSLAGSVHGGQHLTSGEGIGPGAYAQAGAVERREGDISAEQTVLAMNGFVEPRWFAAAVDTLSGRLLFLVGAPGSGRRTAALNLLRRRTGSFALRAVDSDADLTTWKPGTGGARGYLVDGLLETRTMALDTIALDTLRAELHRADAYMVVVTAYTPQVIAHLGDALDAEPVRATPPPARDVLEAKLAVALPDPEGRRSTLAALPSGLLDEILQPHLGPTQVVEIATEIIQVASGGAKAEDIPEHLSFHAAERAPQLVGALRANADDLALLLATCVFEHFDHAVVEDEARRLLRVADGRLDATSPGAAEPRDGPADNPGFAFRRSRKERLTTIGAHRASPEVCTASTYSYLSEPVAFTRHLQGRAVLEYVWREHRDAGDLLMEWLQQAPAGQGRADRAGFILGQLAQWSSGHQALQPIEDLAASARPGDWRMAARALGAASAHPVLASMIKVRLRDWSRGASESRRCVVALTCATEFGLARPELALRLLPVLVTGREDGPGPVESAVRRALLSLFAEAANRPMVIDALLKWSRSPGALRRTACAAVAQLVRTAATVREPGEWWSDHLLAGSAGADCPHEQAPGLALIRAALMEQTSFEATRAAVLQWQQRSLTGSHRARAVEHLTDALAHHLRGGVFRLFTDLERAYPAPGSHRAAQALADWRKAP
ncbi:hypothetical protein ACFY41_05485 [Streptomyces syringium]|uniref:hypothetical protein n=1 Tax=Streptomyces syringium TaxID=76729 RepID=UPI0036870B27